MAEEKKDLELRLERLLELAARARRGKPRRTEEEVIKAIRKTREGLWNRREVR